MAANEKEVSYSITAQVAGFVKGMREAQDSAKESSEKIQGHFEKLSAVFETLEKSLLAVTAVLAGGAVFSEAINSTKEWGLAAEELSMRMGLTTSEALAFKVAAEKYGVSTEMLSSASDKMARQLQTNEKAFKALGLSTRDANGAWRSTGELLPDVIARLQEIDNPTQQAIAGQQLFGRQWSELMPLLLIGKGAFSEAANKVKELNLAVDPEQVRAYTYAMHDVKLVAESLEIQVGNALMPVLTDLGNWFGERGPALARFFADALDVIIKTVKTVISEFNYLGTLIGGVMAAVNAAIHGNLTQARTIMRSTISDLNEMDESLKKLWTTAREEPTPKKEKRGPGMHGVIDFDKPKKEKADKSRLGDWETELTQAQVAYQTENNLREMGKAAELAYWQAKRQAADLTDGEIAGLDKKVADARLAMLKEMHAQESALAQSNISENEKAAMDTLEAKRAAAQEEQQLGLTSRAQLLTQERQFEDQRLVIAQQALQERIALLADDPDRNAVALNKLNNELEDAQRQHNLRVAAINTQIARDSENQWKGTFDKITAGFSNVIQGLVTGTQTITQAFGRLFMSVADAAINMAVKMGAQWLLAAAQRQILGSAQRGTEAVGNANVAAGAAYASTAAIPVVGPALAPAAAASALAAAMAFVPGASAMGGFDIPHGLNPITQLHQREMVLPAHLADPLRASLAGGGMSKPDVHLHVHAVDAKSVEKLFMSHPAALAGAMRNAMRDGHI